MEVNPKKNKIPWPTKAAMEQVYEMKLWGSNNADYYSGEGSHNPEIVNPYIKVVQSFLSSFETPVSICDLGCGDFNIGKKLVEYSKSYIGVDIVSSLIDYNKKHFINKKLIFHTLDIAVDELPNANCVMIRQVLQHLSNNEVMSVVQKLYKYQYIILTEHIPNGKFEPNKDIISGQGIRLKKKSGIDLLASPFYFKVKEEKKILSINLPNNKGLIETVLYKVF